MEQQDGLDDEPGVVALVQVEPALQHGDRPPGEPAEQQPADVAGRRRSRPAGQSVERDRDGILEIVGETAQARAEDDADLGHEIGVLPDGIDERRQAGGLLRWRDGSRRIDGVGMATREPPGVVSA